MIEEDSRYPLDVHLMISIPRQQLVFEGWGRLGSVYMEALHGGEGASSFSGLAGWSASGANAKPDYPVEGWALYLPRLIWFWS